MDISECELGSMSRDIVQTHSWREDNDEFTHFVETYLQDWVGYAEETVSAVNVLMINPETCCTVNATSDMKQFMKKHGIDCVDIPNRHRFILDSGLHCKTLDLKRKS